MVAKCNYPMSAETTKVNSRRAKAIEALIKGDDGKKPVDAKKKKTTSPTGVADDEEPVEAADLSIKVAKKADTLQYEKKSLHDQILLRPDTYIGSVKRSLTSEPVYYFDDANKRFTKGFLQLSDGLIRLFIEVISNAIDNVWRSKEFGIPVKFIKVQITPNQISVWNDGRNIPTGLHPTEKVYTPEMIFGHLLTSSNYNDAEERKTSGKNGLGVKLSNTFSSSFKVNIFNKDEGVLYTQEWSDNMKVCKPAKIAKRGFPKTVMEGSNGFTEVTFTPDFTRFGLTEFDRDHLVLLRKLVYDAAMTVSFHGVKVFINEGEEKEKEVPVKDIKDYVGYYFPNGIPEEHVIVATPDSKVCLVGGADDWTHVSFVNGIITKDGGVHVDAWAKALFDPIVEKCAKKKINVTVRDIRKHFFLFVYSSVDKPAFESQSKNRLTGPKVETDVKAAVTNKIAKWEFMEKLELSQKLKEDKVMKDTTERKRGRVIIRGLDEATKAGTKDGKDCILCVAEGTPINLGSVIVPIEQCKEYIGQTCLTFDTTKQIFCKNRIVNWFDNGVKSCIKILTKDGTNVICTSDHKILSNEGWIEASDSLGKLIIGIDETQKQTLKEIVKIETVGKKKVYDIEVENTHNFLASGIVLHNCTTEGDSAKGYVVAGIKYGMFGKKGNEYIGVMPIRGKFLNVKNAKKSTLIENEEVKAIIQALGLQFNVDYRVEENRKKLRYGKFVAVSDSDSDGFHITGLLYNFFHTLFPTLLEVEGFFNFMRTPILKINKRNQKLSFFYLAQAKEYIENNNVNKEFIKYYKGLGTSTKDDIKDDFGRRVVCLMKDQSADQMVEQVFGNEHSDFRKVWIQNFTPRQSYPVIKDFELEKLNASDFFNYEMIQFSIADNARSIPHVLDGLKESQRKILYVAFKRNLKFDGKSLKVAQFGASVAETTNYHYGENSLFKAIVKMGQRFVGTNNVPLLYDDGNFGSRNGHPKNGIGEDAASPRYIFTRLGELTRYLFRQEDDDYLHNIEDEGEVIEKEHYLPILPVALINGCEGIGSGWRCELPMYNPVDVAAWVKAFINKTDKPSLTPWFRGFKGEVSVENKTVTTKGVLNLVADSTYRVSEIPVGMSIERFKDKVKDLQEDGTIKDILVNNNTENLVDMTFKTTKDLDLKKLGLISTYSLSTMVFFNSENKLVRYEKVEDLLQEFCEKRLWFYSVRKAGELQRMQHQLDILQNKARFIREVLGGTIVLRNKDEDELSAECSKKGYMKIEESFDYLLSIQIKNMTAKKVEQLEENVKSLQVELKAYTNKSTTSMWVEEIDAFLTAFQNSSYMKEEAPVPSAPAKKTKK